MTTSTTNSQAASIDTTEFRCLLTWYASYPTGDHRQDLIAYVDANIGYFVNSETHRCNEIAEARQRGWDQQWDAHMDPLIARAIAAESRLAEIQRGVGGLLQYIADHDWGGIPEPVQQIDALRALLQPQGQADTSEQVHNAGTWQSSNFKVVDRKIQGRISIGDGGGKEMYYLDPLGTDADDDGPIIDTSSLPG